MKKSRNQIRRHEAIVIAAVDVMKEEVQETYANEAIQDDLERKWAQHACYDISLNEASIYGSHFPALRQG